MSSEVKRLPWYITYSCSIKHEEYLLSTIASWQLQHKQDRGQDDAYLPFDQDIGYTQPHCSPPCTRRIYDGILAVFCHLLEIGINKVPGHPCLTSYVFVFYAWIPSLVVETVGVLLFSVYLLFQEEHRIKHVVVSAVYAYCYAGSVK